MHTKKSKKMTQAELDSFQRILSEGCPNGEAYRVINPDGSFICSSPAVTDGINHLMISSGYQQFAFEIGGGPTYNAKSVQVQCPAGWTVSGGGFVSQIRGNHIAVVYEPGHYEWRTSWGGGFWTWVPGQITTEHITASAVDITSSYPYNNGWIVYAVNGEVPSGNFRAVANCIQ